MTLETVPYFITYSSRDGTDLAQRLYDDLRNGTDGLSLWMDRHNLSPGSDWEDQVSDALKSCAALLYLMTPDSVASPVCKAEYARVLRYRKPVIPLLMKADVEPPLRLENWQYINFTQSYDEALSQLRKDLAELQTPAGQLRVHKIYRSDAERELERPTNNLEQHKRFQKAIEKIDQEIDRLEKLIRNPSAEPEETAKKSEDDEFEASAGAVLRLVKLFLKHLPELDGGDASVEHVLHEVTGWSARVFDANQLAETPSFLRRMLQGPSSAHWESCAPPSGLLLPPGLADEPPTYVAWTYPANGSTNGRHIPKGETASPNFKRSLILTTSKKMDPVVVREAEGITRFLPDVINVLRDIQPDRWTWMPPPRDSKLSSNELLAQLQDGDLSLLLRCQTVLATEVTPFSGDQVAVLVELLRSFVLENRDSDDFDTQVAVSAAVRKLVANLPPDQIDSVATLLVADHHVPVPLYVELEVTKSIVQWLLNQPCGEDESELAAKLMELAKTYINPRLLGREKHGATALNAVLGLLLLRTDSTQNVIQLIEHAGVAWFSDLVASRAERLCETLEQRFDGEQRETMTEHLRNAMTQLTSNTRE